MTPELLPDPPGRWWPRLKAARRLGITERTLQRRMKQGLVLQRHDEHNRIQVYVPDSQDTAMTVFPAFDPQLHLINLPETLAAHSAPLLARNAEQETIIRQQAEEIGALRAQLAAAAVPWWRGLWARLTGR